MATRVMDMIVLGCSALIFIFSIASSAGTENEGWFAHDDFFGGSLDFGWREFCAARCVDYADSDEKKLQQVGTASIAMASISVIASFIVMVCASIALKANAHHCLYVGIAAGSLLLGLLILTTIAISFPIVVKNWVEDFGQDEDDLSTEYAYGLMVTCMVLWFIIFGLSGGVLYTSRARHSAKPMEVPDPTRGPTYSAKPMEVPDPTHGPTYTPSTVVAPAATVGTARNMVHQQVQPTGVPTPTPPQTLSSQAVLAQPQAEHTLDPRVSQLLKELSMEKYEQHFIDADVDWNALILLEENDFKDMGLPRGPIVKLMKALRPPVSV